MSVDFDQLFTSLVAGVKGVAEQNLNECIHDAASSGISTIYNLKLELQHWTEQLAAGEIGKEDLEWNLQSAIDASEMTALKQAGLLQIHVDKFKAGLLNLIMQTIQTAIL